MIKKVYILTFALLIFFGQITYAQDAVSTDTKSNISVVKNGDAQKAVDQKVTETKEDIKEKERTTEESKKEAEKVIEEKNLIEKEAEIKTQAAQVAKQESEVLKKEAKVTQDPEALRKAKQLDEQAKQFQKEAEVKKETLSVFEQKALLAQKTLESNQLHVDKLKKELEDLKNQKRALRPWYEQFRDTAVILSIGLVLLLVFKMSMRRLDQNIIRKEKGALRESESALRMRTLNKITHWLGVVLIILLTAYFALESVGVSVAPLLAGVSVIGLAFGFGGQYLIRDIISGIFILFEGQYRINDVVKLGEYAGLVEDISLRITTMRDLQGRVIVVPNGEIKTVVNYTRGYSQALFDIGVAYKENVDKVMEIIRAVGEEMRKDKYFGRLILDKLEMFGVDDFADSAVMIKFRIKTLPIRQWEVMREFKRRLKNRFDELGIEIPFPHRTLYVGTGQDNDWLKKAAVGESA